MRKHRASLCVTYYADSRTVEWYVEADNAAGRWELLSDDSSSSSNAVLDGFSELLGWLEQRMGGGSPPSSRSSDLG